MKDSKISWTDSTFNPWIGCTRVSPGCENCYAETQDHRWGNDSWGVGKTRRMTSKANWDKVRQWDREAGKAGKRHKVFCASMADVFDQEVPDEWRHKLFDLVAATPNLDWLILTKRPEAMKEFFSKVLWLQHVKDAPIIPRYNSTQNDRSQYQDHITRMPENIWLGTTAEDQQRANERMNILCSIPAKIHWVSVEPQLGPVNFDCIFHSRRCQAQGNTTCTCKLNFTTDGNRNYFWVISGGESGAGARPFNLEWARDLRDQCKRAGVPFFMKQMGEKPFVKKQMNENTTIEGIYPGGKMFQSRKGDDPSEWPADLQIQEFPQ